MIPDRFTRSHRGGNGTPMVLLHGFTDTWRTWDLVLPQLEQQHDVLALTLPGHVGAAPIEGEISQEVLIDAVAAAMDEAGFETAHIVGNSLGGYLAFHLAMLGRARSVVALAPAGGWAADDDSAKETLDFFLTVKAQLKSYGVHADELASTAKGRRAATRAITVNYEHLSPDLVAHLIRGAAWCEATVPLVEYALEHGWDLDPERISCPVRIVWGHEDRLLAWPSAAYRFRNEWLPAADWVELDETGHCPQLDRPLETAQLILDFTAT